MRTVRIKIIIVLSVFAGSAFSQQMSTFDPIRDDIAQRLPPLSVLLDSAVNFNPLSRFNDLQVEINQGNLKTTKKNWLENFGVQANYGYGTFDYIYNNSLGTTNPQTYTTKQTTSQYGVGAWLRIPFYDFFDRGNLMDINRAQIEQARMQAASQKLMIREEIIRQYNDLIARQKVFRVQSKYLETARINMQMAEKQFINGSISVDNYSRVQEFSSQTEQNYETSKMEFITAYMILEEMTGMKFKVF